MAAQAADPQSLLSLHRDLLRLRRTFPSLALGEIELLPLQGDILAYLRRLGDEAVLVLMNLGDHVQTFEHTTSELFNADELLWTVSAEASGLSDQDLRALGPGDAMILETAGSSAARWRTLGSDTPQDDWRRRRGLRWIEPGPPSGSFA